MQQAQRSDSFCPERIFKIKEAPASFLDGPADRVGTHTGPLKEKLYQKLSVYMEALERMSGAALIRNDITRPSWRAQKQEHDDVRCSGRHECGFNQQTRCQNPPVNDLIHRWTLF